MNLHVSRPLVVFSHPSTIQTMMDEWIEVTLPLDKFQATSFGRPVSDPGPVDPNAVTGLGFLLDDKKGGHSSRKSSGSRRNELPQPCSCSGMEKNR